mgnify:CR=1 FL=1
MLTFARLAFGGWLLVEVLSWAKILPLTLEFTWFGLVITGGVAWGTIELISWRLRKLGAQNLWGGTLLLVLVSQCTDAGGDIFRMYGTYSWYDQVAHLVGGAAIALVFFNLLTSLHVAQRIRFGPGLRAWFAIMAAMAVGSLYEIEEYAEDILRHANRLGTAFDTANDMLCNSLGAVALVVLLVWIRQRRKLT